MKLGILISAFALISWYGIGETMADNVGDPCVAARTGASGTCRMIEQCQQVRDEIVNFNQFPEPCGFEGNQLQIICCPNPPTEPVVQPTSNRISAIKCTEYNKAVYENRTIINGFGIPDTYSIINKCAFTSVPFIIGGMVTAPKEFPHMALLGYQPDPNDTIQYLCGGSLISEHFVLTAAHCINYNKQVGEVKYVLLGEYDLDATDDIAQPILLRVINYITHERFKLSSKYDDIALVKLERDVKFDQFTRPACLAETFMDSREKKFIATGWGRVSHRGKQSNILQKVTLELFSHDECENAYSIFYTTLNRGIIDSQQFCAGSRNATMDTCPGDSGGPMQISHPSKVCMYMIVGVTSFGRKCGDKNTPGVYIRVYDYLDWIERHVWPQSYN